MSLSYGSSPHTWGIPSVVQAKRPAGRFIPTYVGHTSMPARWATQRTVHPHIHGATSSTCQMVARTSVHPHIRGAYLKIRVRQPRTRGSSPPTWGIRTASSVDKQGLPVHPHLRGAYTRAIHFTTPPCGSSPHTWGIHDVCIFCTGYSRFIPTYVGHTVSQSPNNCSASVHPHIRGAYHCPGVPGGKPGGSSPHTWGIRFTSSINSCRRRFIPTYVGHT